MQKLLTKQEVAERLGITVSGVSRMVCLRRIPFIKVTATKYGPTRFDAEALEAWLRANTIMPIERKGAI